MTDKEIARFSAPVIQAYRDMEDELLRLIAKQIARDKSVSDTSAWRIRQLARAGEINQQALAIIDSYAGGISSEIAEAILAAAEGEVGTLDAAMLNLLSEKGKMTDEQRNMLDAFQRQSRQELNIENARIAESYAQALQEDCNLVNTVMGYQTASAYSKCVRETADELDRQAVINELNQGSMSVVSGTESLQEATRRTLERLAVKGIPGFIDKAGREWSPEAYVKMDLRSTMGNTARAAQDARCDRYGIQLIEVSSHNGARPKCAPYQGRIFSRNGTAGTTTDLNDNPIRYIPLSQTSYGEPDGLFGINCGHQQYPFIPGVSMRTYYPYPEEQNAERYQQTQQQRAMERKIRADKRKCMMMQETGDDEGLRKAAGKLRADKDRYRDFCKETGLGAHNENTQVYGYDRSKSMKTVWAEKGLTGGTNGGIIQEREVFRSRGDPMVEIMGSAMSSNPKETRKILDDLRSWGVEINKSHNLGYGSSKAGSPGVLSFNEEASYSALKHEYQHVLDAKEHGWDAAVVLYGNKDERIRREKRAYGVEMAIAESMGRPDMVKRLQQNLDEEISNINIFFGDV